MVTAVVNRSPSVMIFGYFSIIINVIGEIVCFYVSAYANDDVVPVIVVKRKRLYTRGW